MRDFIVDALAAYRLTRLATQDTITAPIRERIFAKHPPHEKSLSYALTCEWCAGIYAGMGVAVARRVAPKTWSVVGAGLAAAAVAALISERQDNHGSL